MITLWMVLENCCSMFWLFHDRFVKRINLMLFLSIIIPSSTRAPTCVQSLCKLIVRSGNRFVLKWIQTVLRCVLNSDRFQFDRPNGIQNGTNMYYRCRFDNHSMTVFFCVSPSSKSILRNNSIENHLAAMETDVYSRFGLFFMLHTDGASRQHKYEINYFILF